MQYPHEPQMQLVGINHQQQQALGALRTCEKYKEATGHLSPGTGKPHVAVRQEPL